MTNSMIKATGLKKNYEGLDVSVLSGVDLEVRKGERVAIVGTSGSGKSTLLHLLGGLDAPSAGEVIVMGQSLADMTETQRGKLRNQFLGFVYQFHHLLPEFTALENVAMPLLIRRMGQADAFERASAALVKVGLSHRLEHMPSELSGGERQRVALARAIVTEPHFILADEPTGNLDRYTAHAIFDLLLDMNQSQQIGLLVVTHDLELASKLQRQYRLVDGKLSKNT